MSFATILGNLFIGPLKLVFEIIFNVANSFTGNPGLSIIFLSLIMNILVLPLYRRADAMQEEARDIDKKLSAGVAHIKKTFSGDERMMMMQTYYRQNNYKPTDALNGSVSLLLEIPFFTAAYQFLSHLDILDGVSLGPIRDLGAPDGLLVIGGVAINILPIIMTTVNVISCALYLKGFPLKSKIQLYGMAAFFLVFLYTSPACLAFYWTLNNVFSLVKTIFYKLKNPKAVLRVITTVVGLAFITYGGFIYETVSLKRRVFLMGIGVLLLLPLAFYLIGKLRKVDEKAEGVEYKSNRKVFVLGGLLMTVLLGVLIPSAFIAASPQEYVDISYFHNPVWYIVNSASMAAGFFLVWFGVFYWLASPKGKVIFDRLMWVLSGVTVVNYMFFGTDMGIISSILQYENGVAFKITEQLVNIGVICAVTALMLFIIIKFKRVTAGVLAIVTVALGGMSAVNVYGINKSVNQIANSDEAKAIPSFELSQNGKNVVVIMLDRAMNEYVPYMLKEKPELVEKFDGFTYYTNVTSFGGYTNFGIPPLLGGYEYTPVEMNARDTELLADKHNEALKVMPTIFANNGYEVTVCDPVYAGYRWIPDISIFDDCEGVNAYIAGGKFGDVKQKQSVIDTNYRNFFCLSAMKTMPLALQPTVYNNGQYHQVKADTEEGTGYNGQAVNDENVSVATGLTANFMEAYNTMASMTSMTNITDEAKNTYLFIANDMTHEPMLLQTPDYVPSANVDNTEYDAANADRFTVDGKTLKVDTAFQMSHYHANMAAFLMLGDWFDYLRESGVYDNTKIIIAADHGRDLGQMEHLILDENNSLKDVELYYPLLMVKDFGSEGFTTSDEFMTNADVPTLATEGVIENPVNPFTGKPINSDEKTAHEQFIIMSPYWDVSTNNGNGFIKSFWASVKDNIHDKNNWTFYKDGVVLKEHAMN